MSSLDGVEGLFAASDPLSPPSDHSPHNTAPQHTDDYSSDAQLPAFTSAPPLTHLRAFLAHRSLDPLHTAPSATLDTAESNADLAEEAAARFNDILAEVYDRRFDAENSGVWDESDLEHDNASHDSVATGEPLPPQGQEPHIDDSEDDSGSVQTVEWSQSIVDRDASEADFQRELLEVAEEAEQHLARASDGNEIDGASVLQSSRRPRGRREVTFVPEDLAVPYFHSSNNTERVRRRQNVREQGQAMDGARPSQPAVIDLTEEPDSPILHHHSLAHDRRFRQRNEAIVQGGLRRPGPLRPAGDLQPTVIDLTDDADDVVGDGGGGGEDNFQDLQSMDQNHPPAWLSRFANFEDPLSAAGPSRMGRSRAPSIFSLSSLGGLNALSLGRIGNLAQFTNFALDNFPSIAGQHRLPQPLRVPPMARPHHARGHARASRFGRRPRAQGAANADSPFLDFDFLGGINPLQGNLPDLNYQFNGLYESVQGLMNNDKPQYDAPPDALEGFTRSTGESIVAVCAGCDEELAYDPDSRDNEPPPKRVRSRKDREDHHFWAVTKCGHVSFALLFILLGCLPRELTGISGVLQTML